MSLIASQDALLALVERLRGERYITIDTEFMRDRTFWPKLCLVQIAGSEEAVVIDALASGMDLTALSPLLDDLAIIKVFHACRQDLEIFYHMNGRLPQPVFDTQIAAMVCGYGEEVAYETLVVKLARARLDKSSRFTDWSRRPLSEAQLRYALADVTHLRVIYEKLTRRIGEQGRERWVEAEIETLLQPALYEQRPELAHKRLKFRSRDARFTALVQALAAWRESKAQSRDLPRSRIMRDDILLELAASRPTDTEALRRIERLNLDRESAREVVAVINEALALDAAELPVLAEPKQPVRGIGPITDLLRVLLKHCAEENDVAQRLIASSADLEALAADDTADIPALHGWRYELFGKRALRLKRGELALRVAGKKLELIDLADEPEPGEP